MNAMKPKHTWGASGIMLVILRSQTLEKHAPHLSQDGSTPPLCTYIYQTQNVTQNIIPNKPTNPNPEKTTILLIKQSNPESILTRNNSHTHKNVEMVNIPCVEFGHKPTDMWVGNRRKMRKRRIESQKLFCGIVRAFSCLLFSGEKWEIVVCPT